MKVLSLAYPFVVICRNIEQEKDLLLPNYIKTVKGVFNSMAKKAPPPSVVYDFARQVWVTVQPKEEWVYHGDFIISANTKTIVCRCQESETGKVDIYEFDQMYGVGRCIKCSKMHWYKLN